MKVAFLVAGVKGLSLFEELYEECTPSLVSSYQTKNTRDESVQRIQQICELSGLPFAARPDLNTELLNNCDVVLIAGWQFLLPVVGPRFVVFHDSLLPKYRGFAPTVTALLNGDREIGVTAIQPSSEVDAGPVYGQLRVKIDYPITVRHAYALLKPAYGNLGRQIFLSLRKGAMPPAIAQEEAKRSFSIWRDSADGEIDWTLPAEIIKRKVDALGWPYEGAWSVYRGKKFWIDDVVVLPELNFSIRDPGKLWKVGTKSATVICGSGMIEIRTTRDEAGNAIEFSSLRERLGSDRIVR